MHTVVRRSLLYLLHQRNFNWVFPILGRPIPSRFFLTVGYLLRPLELVYGQSRQANQPTEEEEESGRSTTTWRLMFIQLKSSQVKWWWFRKSSTVTLKMKFIDRCPPESMHVRPFLVPCPAMQSKRRAKSSSSSSSSSSCSWNHFLVASWRISGDSSSFLLKILSTNERENKGRRVDCMSHSFPLIALCRRPVCVLINVIRWPSSAPPTVEWALYFIVHCPTLSSFAMTNFDLSSVASRN